MSSNQTYPAETVAKWFLYYNQKQINDTDADLITNLRLQKLLYYAQGMVLARLGHPLFDEELIAWQHGPVVKEVNSIYKKYRPEGIEYQGDYDRSIDPETEAVLKEVYDKFARYSAWGLRQKARSEAPWKETARNAAIPLEAIQAYFKEHYAD